MNTLKNLAFTVVFCAVIVACMVSTVLVYDNISQAAASFANNGSSVSTGSDFSSNNQQLMFLLRAKMV